MRQFYYYGFALYIWGDPVKGTGWNIWYGVNAGASIGMCDYGNRIDFYAARIPYGIKE